MSVIKVTSETSFERIGGTATGGGTFWGLGRLLTGAKGFDELLGNKLALQEFFFTFMLASVSRVIKFLLWESKLVLA